MVRGCVGSQSLSSNLHSLFEGSRQAVDMQVVLILPHRLCFMVRFKVMISGKYINLNKNTKI